MPHVGIPPLTIMLIHCTINELLQPNTDANAPNNPTTNTCDTWLSSLTQFTNLVNEFLWRLVFITVRLVGLIPDSLSDHSPTAQSVGKLNASAEGVI
jgi:ABC-type antimicrobial peptide transport system ATPase subunit